MDSAYGGGKYRIDYVAMTPGAELWMLMNVPAKDRFKAYQRPFEVADTI